MSTNKRAKNGGPCPAVFRPILPWLSRLGMFTNIRPMETAVVDENGQLVEIAGPRQFFHFPFARRLLAVIPGWEETLIHMTQVSSQECKQLEINLSVVYRVNNPVEATCFALHKELSHKPPFTSTELKGLWEEQMRLDLSVVLAHVFAEQQSAPAWQARQSIQDSIKDRLEEKVGKWGIAIEETCLHQIKEQREKR